MVRTKEPATGEVVALSVIDGGKSDEPALDGEVLPPGPTEPVEDRAPGLRMTLRDGCTAKQIAFASAVVSGTSLTDAYVANYNTGRMSRKCIWEEASKLAANPKVTQRILKGQQQKERVTTLTGASLRRGLIQKLDDMSVNAENEAVRLKAVELLGKTDLVGLFVERADKIDKDMSEGELVEEIERRLAAAITS